MSRLGLPWRALCLIVPLAFSAQERPQLTGVEPYRPRLRSAVLAVLVVTAMGCGSSDVVLTLDCSNQARTYVAVVWWSGGGGAAGWTVDSVSLVPTSQFRAEESVLERWSVFDASNATGVVLRWRSDTELEVEYPEGATVHKRDGRSAGDAQYAQHPLRGSTEGVVGQRRAERVLRGRFSNRRQPQASEVATTHGRVELTTTRDDRDAPSRV